MKVAVQCWRAIARRCAEQVPTAAAATTTTTPQYKPRGGDVLSGWGAVSSLSVCYFITLRLVPIPASCVSETCSSLRRRRPTCLMSSAVTYIAGEIIQLVPEYNHYIGRIYRCLEPPSRPRSPRILHWPSRLTTSLTSLIQISQLISTCYSVSS